MSSKEIEVDLIFENVPRLTNWNKKKHLLYFFFYFFVIVFLLAFCIGNPQFSTSETVTKTLDPESPVNEFTLKGVDRNNQYLEGETQYHNKADFGVIANVELQFTIYGSNQEDINNNTKWNEIKTYSLNRSVVSTNIRDPDTKKQFLFKRILPKLIPLLCFFSCLIYDSYIYSHYHTLDKELNGIESVTGYQTNRYILFISFLICLLWITFQYIEIYTNLKKIDKMKNIILNYTISALIPIALSVFIISDYYSPNPSNMEMILILQPMVYNCYFIFLSFAWFPKKSVIGDQDPKIIQSDGDYDDEDDDGDDDDDVEFNNNYNDNFNSINEEDFNSDINSSNINTNRNGRNNNNSSRQNLINNNKSGRKKYLDRGGENGELSNGNNSAFDEFDIDPHPFKSSSNDYSNNEEGLKSGQYNYQSRERKRNQDKNIKDYSRESINKEYEFVATNSENERGNKFRSDSNTNNEEENYQIVKNKKKIQKSHSDFESGSEALDISPDESYVWQKNGNQNNYSQFETYNKQQQQYEDEDDDEEEYNYTTSDEDSEVMLSIFASNINHQNQNPLSTLEQQNKSNDKNGNEKIEEPEKEDDAEERGVEEKKEEKKIERMKNEKKEEKEEEKEKEKEKEKERVERQFNEEEEEEEEERDYEGEDKNEN
ncbi:hypothetical protein M0812_06606 [Anaeramoeba flamelloides]|uniref:Intimal thickness related receptor IRP domain-containing protein n=1 Tax=Anaeramoeba flamelloides TaxID=1746091 RepID=A0AAV8AEU2_9EUKA|nr:hypothetical protein M0812_06606 [Anaeramoeba flamelloides]